MSAALSRRPGIPGEIHSLVEEAARGRLPTWVNTSAGRRDHLRRVSELMDRWGVELGLPDPERARWRAAAVLHDAFKDDPIDELRLQARVEWPDPLLHGPAMAERLRREGVRDEELLLAVSHHSVGHPSFGALGEFLYMADFLDPGRTFRKARREKLRERLPEERREVLLDVLALRLRSLLERRAAILPVSIEFWNSRVAGDNGASG